ncbi:MAG: hypothetical protein Q8K64_00565 [Sediminibacterium sp.]|nr:hypothetical protein [Sediminibacterium sp.]
MHNFRLFVATLFSLFIFACGNSTQKKINSNIPVADTAKFYPIDQFIQEQIRYVDLRNFIITKTNTNKTSSNNAGANKTDSSKLVISKEAFISEASIILNEAIAWSKQKHLYKETVFQDLSTASYTINYTALDAATPIQRVDILLSEETNILKRLFIRKNEQIKDTVITHQYSWVADQSFQISSSAVAPNYNKTTANFVNWAKQEN